MNMREYVQSKNNEGGQGSAYLFNEDSFHEMVLNYPSQFRLIALRTALEGVCVSYGVEQYLSLCDLD